MSEPRRRRRRRRRGATRADTAQAEQRGAKEAIPREQASPEGEAPTGRRRRRRRGSGRRVATEPESPRSSADIFRRDHTPPTVVGAPHDGRTLESVIGELQSEWGVPQSPQEYRITLRVAEERQVRGEAVASIEEVKEDLPPRRSGDAPRREKAPAAPRIGATPPSAGSTDEPAPTRRKRSRRRRRGGRTSS